MKTIVLASWLLVACASADHSPSSGLVEAPVVGAPPSAIASDPPRALPVAAADADVPDAAATAATPDPRAIAAFDALAASICPPANGQTPPSKLSIGGQSLWSLPKRAGAVLVTEIQQLEGQVRGNSSPTPIQFRLAMDYYELEAVAYEECARAASPAPSPSLVQSRTATINARARTMAGAAKMGKRYCAIVNATTTFTPPGPCPEQ